MSEDDQKSFIDDLDNLPAPQKETVQALLIALKIERTWKGPIPPPEVLSEYNNIFPGGARAIFAAVEEQARHRMKMEAIILPKQQKQSAVGQIFAFVLALGFLGASTYLIATGKGLYGTILGGVDLIALVYAFINGKSVQRPTD